MQLIPPSRPPPLLGGAVVYFFIRNTPSCCYKYSIMYRSVHIMVTFSKRKKTYILKKKKHTDLNPNPEHMWPGLKRARVCIPLRVVTPTMHRSIHCFSLWSSSNEKRKKRKKKKSWHRFEGTGELARLLVLRAWAQILHHQKNIKMYF